jgi:DDE superfamily endonuclease
MDAYFSDNLDSNTVIDFSDTRYTNDQIAIQWLQHFIKHTNAGVGSDKKLLLFNGHGSHVTLEFQELARSANIILLQYPPHLTHILQPLDVSVFQSYKHWHKMAVYKAIRTLQYEYNYSCFLRDLTEFRQKTFTESTILSAFQKSGMWPPNVDVVLRKLKKFQDPVPKLPSYSQKSPGKFRPKTVEDIAAGLKA